MADTMVNSLGYAYFADESADAEAAWREEMERRRDDFETGREIGLSIDEVMAELQNRYSRT